MKTPAYRFEHQSLQQRLEQVAPEEPLELRLLTPAGEQPLTTLMRTPGHERQLLLGWLHAERLLPAQYDLQPDAENRNVWRLLTPEHARLAAAARLTVTSSACGVCGTGSIEQLLLQQEKTRWAGPLLGAQWLCDLPKQLQAVQPGFSATGGLHAAGLFSPHGPVLCAFEDVGRHNATDKVVGWALTRGLLPLSGSVLCVSSRAGFEIVQKAVAAGISVVVAVGAATSLAVQTALAFDLTLIGFAREGRFTVYSGLEKLELPAP